MEEKNKIIKGTIEYLANNGFATLDDFTNAINELKGSTLQPQTDTGVIAPTIDTTPSPVSVEPTPVSIPEPAAETPTIPDMVQPIDTNPISSEAPSVQPDIPVLDSIQAVVPPAVETPVAPVETTPPVDATPSTTQPTTM